MTQKDYIKVAAILNDRTLHLPEAKKDALVSRFVDLFTDDNARFSERKFISACGVQREPSVCGGNGDHHWQPITSCDECK